MYSTKINNDNVKTEERLHFLTVYIWVNLCENHFLFYFIFEIGNQRIGIKITQILRIYDFEINLFVIDHERKKDLRADIEFF